MKLEIKESYSGELSEDSKLVRDKAEWALASALKEVGVKDCCGGLHKALTAGPDRIGEMQVIEDLTQILSKAYEARLSALRDALVEEITDGPE